MSTQDLTALPASFAAGTTVSYSKTFADYPASIWSMTLYLAGKKILEVAAVADGDAFDLTIAASLTERDFDPGVYKWEERVTNGSEVYRVAYGRVKIEPNLEQATEGSEQDWLEPAIAALTLHIAGRLPRGMESYSIAGRAVSRIPIKEAMSLRASLKSELARSLAPGKITRPVLVTFTPPG